MSARARGRRRGARHLERRAADHPRAARRVDHAGLERPRAAEAAHLHVQPRERDAELAQRARARAVRGGGGRAADVRRAQRRGLHMQDGLAEAVPARIRAHIVRAAVAVAVAAWVEGGRGDEGCWGRRDWMRSGVNEEVDDGVCGKRGVCAR